MCSSDLKVRPWLTDRKFRNWKISERKIERICEKKRMSAEGKGGEELGLGFGVASAWLSRGGLGPSTPCPPALFPSAVVSRTEEGEEEVGWPVGL